jgi:hypothetical protein
MAITLFALETTIAQTLGRMETDNLEGSCPDGESSPA